MRIKRTAISLLLAATLTAGACTKGVNTDPTAFLNDIRARAARVDAYAQGALDALDTLRTIPQMASLIEKVDRVRPLLDNFHNNADKFAAAVVAVSTFDKAKLQASFDALSSALESLRVPLSDLVAGIAKLINKNADTERLRAEVNLVITLGATAVRVIGSNFQ